MSDEKTSKDCKHEFTEEGWFKPDNKSIPPYAIKLCVECGEVLGQVARSESTQTVREGFLEMQARYPGRDISPLAFELGWIARGETAPADSLVRQMWEADQKVYRAQEQELNALREGIEWIFQKCSLASDPCAWQKAAELRKTWKGRDTTRPDNKPLEAQGRDNRGMPADSKSSDADKASRASTCEILHASHVTCVLCHKGPWPDPVGARASIFGHPNESKDGVCWNCKSGPGTRRRKDRV